VSAKVLTGIMSEIKKGKMLLLKKIKEIRNNKNGGLKSFLGGESGPFNSNIQRAGSNYLLFLD